LAARLPTSMCLHPLGYVLISRFDNTWRYCKRNILRISRICLHWIDEMLGHTSWATDIRAWLSHGSETNLPIILKQNKIHSVLCCIYVSRLTIRRSWSLLIQSSHARVRTDSRWVYSTVENWIGSCSHGFCSQLQVNGLVLCDSFWSICACFNCGIHQKTKSCQYNWHYIDQDNCSYSYICQLKYDSLGSLDYQRKQKPWFIIQLRFLGWRDAINSG